MFEIECKVLGSTNGVSKKSGNSYRLAMLRVGENVMNVRVDPSCDDLVAYHDKDVLAKFKLGAYNLNPNVSLVSIE